MPLVLNEEQKLLKDTAREFIQAHAPVEAFRQLRDSHDPIGYSGPLWQQMAELGWAGITLPEAYGGLEFGFAGLGVVLEESGKTLARSPLLASVVLGASAILLGGNEAQKQAWLPEVAAGTLTLALAVDEGPHHTPDTLNTTAQARDGGYCLSGEKHFVVDGHSADKIVVAARTDSGPALFVIDGDSPGLTRSPRRMLDSHPAASLLLDQVQVGADRRLGDGDDGQALLDAVLDRGRIAVAAEMLGGMQAMFRRTLDYLNEREQFGVKIGSFQALKHRSAHMYAEIELCKSVVLEALQAIDEKPAQLAALASLAKARAGDTCLLVMDEAVQMHGGIGVTDELDVGLFLKRSRVLNHLFGNPAFHRARYAHLHGY